jgi:hypothetical protein
VGLIFVRCHALPFIAAMSVGCSVISASACASVSHRGSGFSDGVHAHVPHLLSAELVRVFVVLNAAFLSSTHFRGNPPSSFYFIMLVFSAEHGSVLMSDGREPRNKGLY